MEKINEIVEIVKKISAVDEQLKNIENFMGEIEKANKELVANKIYDLREPQESIKINVINRETELLQELSETQNVWTREAIIKEIMKIRAEEIKNLTERKIKYEENKGAKQEELNEKIKIAKKEIDIYNVEEGIVSSIKEEVASKKKTIENNKTDCYRLKNNMKFLIDENGIIKPGSKDAYSELSMQLFKKVKSNRQLNDEVKQMEQRVEACESKKEEMLKLKEIVKAVEEKRFSEILEIKKDDIDKKSTPEGQTPEGQTPEGQTPEGQTPEGQTPEGQTPEGKIPEGQTPEGQTPEGKKQGFLAKIKLIFNKIKGNFSKLGALLKNIINNRKLLNSGNEENQIENKGEWEFIGNEQGTEQDTVAQKVGAELSEEEQKAFREGEQTVIANSEQPERHGSPVDKPMDDMMRKLFGDEK